MFTAFGNFVGKPFGNLVQRRLSQPFLLEEKRFSFFSRRRKSKKRDLVIHAKPRKPAAPVKTRAPRVFQKLFSFTGRRRGGVFLKAVTPVVRVYCIR